MSLPRLTKTIALAAGKVLLRLGAWAYGPARRLLAYAADLGPEARGWLAVAEGLSASARGDSERALDRLRAASIDLPDNADVAVSLALALFNCNRWDAAIDAAERALKFFEEAGGATALWQMLAWAYLITGRYRSVLELMQRMRDSGVNIAAIHLPLILARSIIWKERPPMRLLRSLLRNERQQPGACLPFVEHLAATGHDELATDILACMPSSVAIRALDTLASRAAAAGNPDQVLWAANALRRLELAPALSVAIASLASLVAGDTSSSQTYARQAAELGPDEVAVQEILTLVWLLTGEEKLARSSAARAVMAGSRDALAGALVAQGFLDEGHSARARQVFSVQRYAGAVGALVGHLVVARIFAETEQEGDVPELLTMAVSEAADVPAWARRPELAAFVGRLLDRLDQAGAGTWAPDPFQRLRRWLSSLPGGHAPASPP